MKFKHFIFLLLGLVSCDDSGKKQFEYGGGKLVKCIDALPITLNPFEVNDYHSSEILMQTLEGLVSFDGNSKQIIGQIAKDWDVSSDGLKYTFTIREGVYFHPHTLFKNMKDRLLTSEDVVATFKKACTKNKKGEPTIVYQLLCKDLLKGAEEYYLGKSKTISGLTCKGNQITFQLLRKDDNFLYKLASTNGFILPKKLLESNILETAVGTGPFMFLDQKEVNQLAQIVLVKNPDYYEVSSEGYALPYLDSVVYIAQAKRLEQLELFENKKIDMILGLPTGSITKILEGNIEDFNSRPPRLLLYNNPQLRIDYYMFDLSDPRFKDPKVRQAFNYAIDREKIGREILKNQYEELGYYGIVPPIQNDFKGYDFGAIKRQGYTYNPEKAKKLFSEAGYSDGKEFGAVTLRFSIGVINATVSDEISRQLGQVLGVTVNIDGSNFEQLEEDSQKGNGDIFKTTWIADYLSLENFLTAFYGKHLKQTKGYSINRAKYQNQQFDLFFEQAMNADKLIDKLTLYNKAELELVKDPPFIILWYSGQLQIVHSNVRNLNFNSLETFNLKTVYKKDWTEEEYLQHQKHRL